MSTSPQAEPAAGPALPGPAQAAPRPLFGGCLSCRFVCGAGLLAAAAWLYQGPRSSMRRGIPPTMGTIAQITFAISVGAWGIVILADPVGKQLPKEPRGGGRDPPRTPPPHPWDPPRADKGGGGGHPQ